MDQSLTESDLSMSPTQILERLQMLRQHQLLQRVKLQKQRLEYQESPENSSVVTEFVSHFTNSTSYNTFRSLLQSYDETSKCSPRPKDLMTSNIGNKLEEKDLVDGVSVLNLSQESDCIVTPPLSSGSRVSGSSNSVSINVSSPQNSNNNSARNSANKKHIELDEIPILTPKKDFEAMIIEKLQIEMQKKIPKPVISNSNKQTSEKSKKSFLRRGEGMARFGLTKNDVIIQNTTALPWKRKSVDTKANNTKKINSKVHGKRLPKSGNPIKPLKHNEYKVNVEILVPPEQSLKLKRTVPVSDSTSELKTPAVVDTKDMENTTETVDTSHCYIHAVKTPVQERPQGVHPLKANKGKTWAAILTKEQDDFLRQLKQSDYYKNFASPAKSVLSDISCDENLTILRQEREVADQKMFDLLENKVAHESFSIENSFFNRFLKKKQLECSGESTRESTPMILQKCLARNPNLMHIFPGSQSKKTHEEIHSNVETCDSDYTDCDHESFSTESGCSSCETAEKNQSLCMQKETVSKDTGHKDRTTKTRTEKDKPSGKDKCQDNIVTENATMKADMAEMNEKLAATSELLKDRLKELEDEIETFRKENSNLAKMREEVDLERQKFYEEKATFEQKYNEEKILSEYYLAEEKDRLAKQKQVYERYVREMRGRLNKKEKDEVINLKNEISDLKDEIRVKDAKSTSCIARLRNQLKIMEKEKTNIQGEVEKLKKENRRLHHSNEITRRMTNIKYLQEINKKLTSMTSKESQSEVKTDGDIKYKAFEIERQSRSRKREPTTNKTIMPRAKSVPNLNVTSRYAKYFSQRDAHSQMDEDKTINTEHKSPYSCESDEYEETIKYDVNEFLNLDDSASISDKEDRENEVQNNLEKLYTERFKCTSPHSSTSSLSKSNSRHSLSDKPDNQTADNVNTNCFFLRKSNFSADSDRNSKSPNERHTSPYLHTSTESNSSKSPVSVLTHRSNRDQQSTEHLTNHSSSNSRLKSPISILSNHSSGSQRSSNEYHHSDIRTLDPSCSKTSLTKTSLNPTEIKKPDGSRELRFPNGNVKHISADGKYSKFIYYNGDVKENFYNEGRIKYFYAETKTYHVTHGDGLEVLEFPDGQIEKRYRDGSSEIRLPNGSVRYQDPKNRHVREEWRFPDGTTMTVSATGEERVVFSNGQVEVHAKDHKRREFPNGTVKMVYNDGTSETRFSSGRVRIKDKHGNLIMDSASR